MELRVYYEDTDAAGVVYHASYVRFFERARTEYLRGHGLSVADLAAGGQVFPVVRMELDFRSPARHDDLLRIVTCPERVGKSTFVMRQQALRASDGQLLVEALVTLACVTPAMKPQRIPAAIRCALGEEPGERPQR